MCFYALILNIIDALNVTRDLITGWDQRYYNNEIY